MDLQSWAAFAAIFAALVANFAMTSRRFDKLDAKIDAVDSKLDAKIDGVDSKLDAKIDGLESKLEAKIDNLRTELREEMAAGFNRIDARLTMIEQRTFDLSTRLPPTPPAPVARQA